MTFRVSVATEDFGSPLRRTISQSAELSSVRGLRLNARTEVRPDEFTDTGLRQLRHLIEGHDLKVAGLLFPTRHLFCDPERLDQRLDKLRSCLPVAFKLGASEVLIRVGRIPDPDDVAVAETKAASNADVDSLLNPFRFAAPSSVKGSGARSPAAEFLLMCDVLSDVAAMALKQGITIQLQLSQYIAGRVRRLLEAVKTGPLKIVFDPASCLMHGAKPVKTFRELYDTVGTIRARDAIVDAEGAGTEVAIGDGGVDWTEVMAVIAEAGLSGWFCVERTGGDSRADDVRQALDRLKLLLPR